MNPAESEACVRAMQVAWPTADWSEAIMLRWADRFAAVPLPLALQVFAALEAECQFLPSWSQWCERMAVVRRRDRMLANGTAALPPAPPSPEQVDRCRSIIAECRATLAR